LNSSNELVQRFIRGQADRRDLDLIRRGFDENTPRRRRDDPPAMPSPDPGAHR